MAESIVCVQLLDDFSGSAKVFAAAVEVLREAGHDTRVVVGSHGSGGFVRRRHTVETVEYRFRKGRLLLLAGFLRTQWRLYAHVRRSLRVGGATAVYVSTVLPLGAIVAGHVCRRPVVTHLHEVGLGTRSLFRVLLAGAVRWSTRIVGVSHYVAATLKLPADRTTTIHNSLDPGEWAQARRIADGRQPPSAGQPFRVLMACSLKRYKGVDEFVGLARACRDSADPALQRARFKLVLNCEPEELGAFQRGLAEDDPVELVRRPASLYEHYAGTHLVLNLSLPEAWIETFGLTLLEAMACGIPVVSPLVGGCTELFEPGRGGWRIDARDTPALTARIARLAGDPQAWTAASDEALEAASRFSPAVFAARITELFSRL